MLINLFHTVRSSGVPCTLRELLDLLGALEKNLAFADMEDFLFSFKNCSCEGREKL